MQHETSTRVGKSTIGDGWPTFVVAEMACTHDGQPERAHRLIDVAAAARVDAVQLQLFSADRIVSPFHANYAVAKALEIAATEWPAIIARARRRGVQVWANVFDEDALTVALSAGVDALKLHSTDLSNPRMLDAVGGTGLPVSLAVGGSTLDEIARAVLRLRERGTRDLVVMHGYQAYPTAPQDAALRFISTLKHLVRCPVGYQDHTDGASDLALVLPLVAVGAGADLLEKHFTDNRARRGTDYESSLDPEDLVRFVQLVHSTDEALGDGGISQMAPAQVNYRRTMKKTIVAGRAISRGELVTEDSLAFMRGEQGLAPFDSGALVGRRAARDIPRFATIKAGDLVPAEDGEEVERGKQA